jgi:hypothetical protein
VSPLIIGAPFVLRVMPVVYPAVHLALIAAVWLTAPRQRVRM